MYLGGIEVCLSSSIPLIVTSFVFYRLVRRRRSVCPLLDELQQELELLLISLTGREDDSGRSVWFSLNASGALEALEKSTRDLALMLLLERARFGQSRERVEALAFMYLLAHARTLAIEGLGSSRKFAKVLEKQMLQILSGFEVVDFWGTDNCVSLLFQVFGSIEFWLMSLGIRDPACKNFHWGRYSISWSAEAKEFSDSFGSWQPEATQVAAARKFFCWEMAALLQKPWGDSRRFLSVFRSVAGAEEGLTFDGICQRAAAINGKRKPYSLSVVKGDVRGLRFLFEKPPGARPERDHRYKLSAVGRVVEELLESEVDSQEESSDPRELQEMSKGLDQLDTVLEKILEVQGRLGGSGGPSLSSGWHVLLARFQRNVGETRELISRTRG